MGYVENSTPIGYFGWRSQKGVLDVIGSHDTNHRTRTESGRFGTPVRL
jgi:hypothetical protein